jgi:hypothetical protein
MTHSAGLVVAAALASGCHPLHSPIAMNASTSTSALGFPTQWFEFPIDGVQIWTTLTGTVSVTNSTNLYAEELFILEFLPADACIEGKQAPWAPNPQLATGIANFIVKTPTAGTFTLPINLTLEGGVPIDNCIALGINGGPVEAKHEISATANLSFSFVSPKNEGPSQTALWVGGEMCFGQSFGCQLATSDDSRSFAAVTPIDHTQKLVALYGDISDSTFDGGKPYGPLPAGAWTAFNEFFVYHGKECSTGGLHPGPVGPGSFASEIPSDATRLLSMPLSGNGIGVVTTQVFQAFDDTTIHGGDCIVTLWSLTGGGAFDNETQVYALLAPE